ncbi:lipopolysaccharide biosynthesis protein [Stappia stellulata]|uniref:lipopolysaccharide biosynthesis protein n=1 Tax=Stappia TaxID=152161 RepID=UPI001CD35DB9|nr:lipopolysaccharide biosynthesis protein [Stappia stellulata]MCA1243540.1 lipopolysaccharide biosynthesis protein [Stappia stellulata]
MSEKSDVKLAAPEKSKAVNSQPKTEDAASETAKQVKEQKEPRVIPLRIDRAAAAIVRKTDLNMRPRQWRRLLLKLSFALCVLLPGLLGALYFFVIASDRYAASASFSVRSMDATPAGGDFLGAIAGLSSVGTTTTDSFILLEYLKSRELIEKVQSEFDLRSAFSNSNIDFLYRLDADAPIEDVVSYWGSMITASYENTSSILTFEVQAFTAEDAEAIASLIVKYSQELINKLSESARQDAVRFAQKEVATAEVRLKVIREEMRKFRSSSRAVDPAASAAAQLQLVTGIESQLIELRARLGTLLASLDEDALPVVQIRKQIASLEKQMIERQTEVNGEGQDASRIGRGLSSLLSDYEKLQVDMEFGQKSYAAALSSLERARAEADRQQRFLAVFVSPGIPQTAIYPYRFIGATLTFVIALILWSIGVLIAYSVRDSMR